MEEHVSGSTFPFSMVITMPPKPEWVEQQPASFRVRFCHHDRALNFLFDKSPTKALPAEQVFNSLQDTFYIYLQDIFSKPTA